MRLWLLLALAACGCREPSVTGAPPEASTGRRATASSADAPSAVERPREDDPGPEAPASWRELVSLGAWAEAAERFDAELPEGASEPPHRYARARMAIETDDHVTALRLLDEALEQQLPLLADDVRRSRARVQLEVGPFDAAVRYFAALGDPESALDAALAEERGGDAEAAFRRVDAVTTRLGRARRRRDSEAALLVRARAQRAHLAEKLGRKRPLIVDLRWLCLEAPTSSQSVGADQKLELIADEAKLTALERHARALALAKDGQKERALREADQVQKAPGNQPEAGELSHVRGWAHYYARSYEAAAEQLEAAARQSARHRVQDAFYAARALSRAGRDDAAIVAYRKYSRAYPKSRFAEEARYLVAHLEYIRGRHEAAETAYDAYLVRHPRGRFAGSTRYERGLTRLARGKHAEAAEDLSTAARLERSARSRALVDELHAVALAGAGKREAAVALLRKVIDEHPLSFAAQGAMARLAALGESAPVAIAPAEKAAPPPSLEVTLPPRAALLHGLGLDGDAEADVREHADEIVSRFAPRGTEALCATYAILSTARERYRHAQRHIKAAVLDRAPGETTRWAWDCLYPRPFFSLVEREERRRALPKGLLHAVMRQESGFMHDAVSPASAHGLMQFIRPTAEKVAAAIDVPIGDVDLTSPGLNIRMGAYYLDRLLERFGGKVALAAAAYNAGPHAVSRWLEGGESLPLDLFVARIPYSETRTYVQRVVGNLARYSLLRAGPSGEAALDLSIPKGLRARADDY